MATTEVEPPFSDVRTYFSSTLHFFVRPMSGGNTIVIHANSSDSVESVHDQIRKITGIPISEQRLIYKGKQLQCEKSLDECEIENDAGLQLVGRMRSTEYPETWRVVNGLVSLICRLCKNETTVKTSTGIVIEIIKEFLNRIRAVDDRQSAGHLQVFKSTGAPSALVMLFLSPIDGNRDCAESSIRYFLSPQINSLPENKRQQFVPVVLEFCKLLSKTGCSVDVEVLFVSCRNTLGTLFESTGNHGWQLFFNSKASLAIEEIYPFVFDLSSRLRFSLKNISDNRTAKFLRDVHDFSAFLIPLCGAIVDKVGGDGRLPIYLSTTKPCCMPEIESLHTIFLDMLKVIDEGLKNLDWILAAKDEASEIESSRLAYNQHLTVLMELRHISKLYQGAEEKFSRVMGWRRFLSSAPRRYSTPRDQTAESANRPSLARPMSCIISFLSIVLLLAIISMGKIIFF